MKKRVLALLLASVMVFSLSACGGSKTEEPEQSPESGTEEKAPEEGGYKDTIVYSLDASPTGDFLSVQSGSDYNTSVMCAIHSALLVADPEGNLEDYLAESHEISEDGTVITFHLHDNAYFSDGEKVTADDVAFTLTYMCCPEAENWADSSTMIKGAAAYHAGETDSVEGIKVIDENTVEFTLEQYYPNALPFIGMMGIIPEHIWKDIPYSEIENHRELLGENTVGCGPYHVIENVDGEYVKLEASDNFFLGDVATKYFIFKVTNADSVTTELKTGTIDVAAVTNLLKAEIDQVDNEGFDIKYFPYDLVQSMKFNSSDTNATPAPVRLAFRYGIDINEFIDGYMEGRGTAAAIQISTGSWAFPSDVKVDYSVDKAKKVLDDAGYKDVNNDGFVEDPDGNEYVFKLVYPLGLTAREKFAVVAQEKAKEFGIHVEIEGTDFPTIMKLQEDPSAYDAFLMGYGVDSVDPDLNKFGMINYYVESEDAYNMLQEAASEIDQAKRVELYKNAAEILKDSPTTSIPLYCMEKAYAYRDTIENYDAGTFNNFYNLYQWKMAE